jgi:hypothetical protein
MRLGLISDLIFISLCLPSTALGTVLYTSIGPTWASSSSAFAIHTDSGAPATPFVITGAGSFNLDSLTIASFLQNETDLISAYLLFNTLDQFGADAPGAQIAVIQLNPPNFYGAKLVTGIPGQAVTLQSNLKYWLALRTASDTADEWLAATTGQSAVSEYCTAASFSGCVGQPDSWSPFAGGRIRSPALQLDGTSVSEPSSFRLALGSIMALSPLLWACRLNRSK